MVVSKVREFLYKPGEAVPMEKLYKPLPTTGLKYDTEKARVDLLDSSWLEGVGHVLRFGAAKYDAHNWRNGIAVSRNLGAALRHIFAVLRGEDKDPESALHHLLHASCCLMFAYWTLVNKPEFDDRWKP